MNKISTIIISILIIILISTTVAYNFYKTNPLTEKEKISQIQKAYYNWGFAVEQAKGDPNTVVSYYASRAVLIPTLDNDLHFKAILERDSIIRDYFIKFTALKNIHVKTDQLITKIYGDVAINVGHYTFTYQKNNGQTKSLSARFSFIYQLKDHNKWLIIEHHSSLLPEDN